MNKNACWAAIICMATMGILSEAMFKDEKKKEAKVVLPHTKKKVNHGDYVRIMAAFIQLPDEVKNELVNAILRNRPLDDLKVVFELAKYDLVDQQGKILDETKKIIAGVATFKDGRLEINDRPEIRGKPRPLVDVNEHRGSISQESAQPGIQSPACDPAADTFTIHNPNPDARYCCTYGNDGGSIVPKRKCEYCKHPPRGCQKEGCLYCKPRSRLKMLSELNDNKHELNNKSYIIEFRDNNGRPIFWDEAHVLGSTPEQVIVRARKRLLAAAVA